VLTYSRNAIANTNVEKFFAQSAEQFYREGRITELFLQLKIPSVLAQSTEQVYREGRSTEFLLLLQMPSCFIAKAR
jgi:hypothetical protein